MAIEDRIGDWSTSPPRVYTPVLQDADDPIPDDADDDDRQLILDARERKARRLEAEREQARSQDEPT